MASSSARRWTCVYTKDIHKKQKHRKKYEDGVLDVWEDQNNKARLFAADDDGNPKGEALAFGNLSAREISALVDGDDIRIEGYDVTPEEEQGEGGGPKAPGAAVANPPFAPRVTIARPRAVAPGASMANIRKPFNQPFKPPAFTARPKAVEEPPAYKAARMSPEPETEIDEEAAARELDAYWAQIRAARAESGRTAGGFDDLYEEARRENPGDASLRPAPVERAMDPSSSKKAAVPLAQRKSKWAVYAGGDTRKAKEEPEPEISGFAAAIQAAGEAAILSAPWPDWARGAIPSHGRATMIFLPRRRQRWRGGEGAHRRRRDRGGRVRTSPTRSPHRSPPSSRRSSVGRSLSNPRLPLKTSSSTPPS